MLFIGSWWLYYSKKRIPKEVTGLGKGLLPKVSEILRHTIDKPSLHKESPESHGRRFRSSTKRAGKGMASPRLRATAPTTGPKDHMDIRISHSGSRGPYEGDTRNHGLQDPYVYVATWSALSR